MKDVRIFRIEIADPVTRTIVTLEEGLTGTGYLKVASHDQDVNLICRWDFSEAGLRTLARSAAALADQVRQSVQVAREEAEERQPRRT